MSITARSEAQGMSTVELAYVQIDFDAGKRMSDFPAGDWAYWLIELLKRGYVMCDVPTDRFEEQVDAILRYPDRLDWSTYGARLRIPGEDLWRYPTLVSWVS